MSEWQPIETAPKDGSSILVFCKYGVRIAYWNIGPCIWERKSVPCWTVFEPDDYFYAEHLLEEAEPTHWMPLPLPPTQQLMETADGR